MWLRSVLLLAAITLSFGSTTPEQIHLALTGEPTSLVVSWATNDDTKTSTVLYGLHPSNLSNAATGTYHHYYWLPLYKSPALHSVTLHDLKTNSKYYYKCGDEEGGFSEVFHFHTPDTGPVSSKSSVKIAVLADNGHCEHSQMVLDAMSKADSDLGFDFLILSGDLSYANSYQPIWDDWGKMIQPLASHFPWMVAPGNHEAMSLFLAYNKRFNMPQNGDGNLYYSFNYRNVHVLVLNSESLNEFHWSPMYQFAKHDLESVDKNETPWIIAAFHHPWYCSNTNHNNSAWFMKMEYEDLFFKHKVSMVLQGHVHAYERTYPVYNGQLIEGAPVYMVDGHGGNAEGLYNHWWKKPDWSAYREAEYGFSTIEIHNNTHLHWQMIRANDSMVRDDAWITI